MCHFTRFSWYVRNAHIHSASIYALIHAERNVTDIDIWVAGGTVAKSNWRQTPENNNKKVDQRAASSKRYVVVCGMCYANIIRRWIDDDSARSWVWTILNIVSAQNTHFGTAIRLFNAVADSRTHTYVRRQLISQPPSKCHMCLKVSIGSILLCTVRMHVLVHSAYRLVEYYCLTFAQ